MVGMLQALIPDCAALLPPDISTEQFRAALWLELSGRPALSESVLDDLRLCIVKAATFGLLPGRDCHFLPFRNKQKGNKISATYVPNYQGILRSLYRTGQVAHAFAEVVYTHDVYDLDYGRTPPLIHKPPRKNRGVGEGAYGYILVKGSAVPLIHYMDPDDIDRVRRKSPAHEQGPWVSDLNEMKRKTAMKNVAKYAPLSPLVQQLLADDDARQETDQPAARYHANVTDLFDQTSATTSTTSNRADVVDSETGEVVEGDIPLEMPSQKPTAQPRPVRQDGVAWDTLA
jgi:recombination protein RecT